MNELLAEVRADQTLVGTTCLVCIHLGSLPIEDQAKWHELFAQPVRGPLKVSHASILRALRKRGVEISEAAVKRHRYNHS